MTTLNTIADLPRIPNLGRSATDEQVRSVHSAASSDGRNDQSVGDRYRVDDSYRAERRRAGDPSSREFSDGRSRQTKISPRELLDSMIQQMGGAYESRAKGTYVDIVI